MLDIIKKAECQIIDAFELWCWRKLLRVPWTARRSNQWILKEINPEYSLEGLMLKLKLQYFGHLMRRADSLEKTLMLGKIESKRRRGRQRMRWYHRLNGHGFGWILGVGDGQGGLVCCGSWGHKELDTTERLNWTDGFSSSHVWMWDLDCKKTECWRIDPFKLWCWRRLLRVFWMARRSNQSILKESTLNIYGKDWCWNWNSSTLTTWCESPIHWKRPWCWERLKAKGEGVIED